MRVRLILGAVATAAAVLPVGAANAACPGYTYVPATGVGVRACTEGLAPVPGGWTSASIVGVSVNGGTIEFCIARTTVTITGGVVHDPRTIYPC
ncbi:MAG TPA: hypothetical protein VGX28_09235 [Frankiaceae bacterium]|jgi:hypothetical protein|nr:hypothetical protein [Frankiaceae bacterium]